MGLVSSQSCDEKDAVLTNIKPIEKSKINISPKEQTRNNTATIGSNLVLKDGISEPGQISEHRHSLNVERFQIQ